MHGIQPDVDTDADVVVLVAPFAVHPDRLELICQIIVVCENSTPVAVPSQRFGRKKGRAADMAQTAGLAAPIFRPQGLGRIFDDPQTVFLSYGVDSVIVSRQAEEINRNNRPRRYRGWGTERGLTLISD